MSCTTYLRQNTLNTNNTVQHFFAPELKIVGSDQIVCAYKENGIRFSRTTKLTESNLDIGTSLFFKLSLFKNCDVGKYFFHWHILFCRVSDP